MAEMGQRSSCPCAPDTSAATELTDTTSDFGRSSFPLGRNPALADFGAEPSLKECCAHLIDRVALDNLELLGQCRREGPRTMRDAYAFSLALGFFAFSSISASADDIAAGKAKAAECFDCHGSAGISKNPDVPNLAGQQANYLIEQMRNFKSGLRDNPFCVPMVDHLSDEDIKNVAAYFSSLQRN